MALIQNHTIALSPTLDPDPKPPHCSPISNSWPGSQNLHGSPSFRSVPWSQDLGTKFARVRRRTHTDRQLLGSHRIEDWRHSTDCIERRRRIPCPKHLSDMPPHRATTFVIVVVLAPFWEKTSWESSLTQTTYWCGKECVCVCGGGGGDSSTTAGFTKIRVSYVWTTTGFPLRMTGDKKKFFFFKYWIPPGICLEVDFSVVNGYVLTLRCANCWLVLFLFLLCCLCCWLCCV